MQELTVNPVPKQFSMSQEMDFVKELEDSDRHSVMWQLSRPEDIVLDSQAEIGTKPKFKLTTLALYQLCQNVCPGLYGFVRELSGVHRTVDEARSDYSIEDCVDIINRTIRRRFDSRLHGKVLLRNTKCGTIDGVLSPGYRWLSNLRLYEMTREAINHCESKPVFWEAQLSGRWLLLRYCNTKPYFSFSLPGENVNNHEQLPGITERFYTGYHFSNDELGRATVRGAPFLLRKDGLTAALAPLEAKGRVRHSGASFEERLTQLLASTVDHVPSADKYESAVTDLLYQNLGLGNKLHKEEIKTRQKLVDKLVRKEIPVIVIRRIVGSLCTQPGFACRTKFEFRNVDKSKFDLYVAMGREAKTLPIRLRESVEQLAYELLFNKVTLN